MRISSYKYLVNQELGDGYMTQQYTKRLKEYMESIELEGNTAVLYAGGVLLSASETRNTIDRGNLRRNMQDSTMAVKELAAYSMHRWIGMLNDADKVTFASINGNTCASSIYSLYEAEKLMNEGYDEAIIITEEKTSYNTLRVFKEGMIDLKVGEGVAIMHLTRDGNDIHSCKWWYEYGRNPFGVTESGYRNVWQECDTVKPHGTGTNNNEEAEQAVIGSKEQVRFKEQVGHCQGASGLIEVCMLLDSDVKGSVLCQAAGMGGFYGSCIVEK